MIHMRYWWANQNQTYDREVSGGYFWCRQRKSNGMRNPFYDAVRLTRIGDVIFAYCKGVLRAVGLVLSSVDEAADPAAKAGAERVQGWLVRVAWLELKRPLRPLDHLELLKPLLPENYAPLTLEGKGIQGGRLMPLPQMLARALIQLAGGTDPEHLVAPDWRNRQMKFSFHNHDDEREEMP